MSRLSRGFMVSLIWLAVFCFILPLASAKSVDAVFDAGNRLTWPIVYQDEIFTRSGKTYHQDTALTSLGMALSAFRAKEQDLSNKGFNVKNYLDGLGFLDISLAQYDVAPSIKTIATAIGHKTITGPEGSFEVVAVAVSGGGYLDEWKSNFVIGSGTHHEGFDQAARQVVDRLLAYAKAHHLKSPKVWISGYSRAAATANRTAAILLERRFVQADNLFAYTFATPNNTRQQNAKSYPAIFNVVGSFDPVTMVPFTDWGYSRFGKTFFLPAPEINSDYQTRAAPVMTVYNRMTGINFWFNSSSNTVIQKLLGAVSETVPDPQSYQTNLQGYLTDLWVNRNNPYQALLTTAKEVLKRPDFRATMKSLGGKFLDIFSSFTQEKMMQESGMLKDEWQNEGGVKQNLVQEHMPTVYLAWMTAYQSAEDLFTPATTYREVRLKQVERVQVINQKGAIIASFDAKYLMSQDNSRLPMTMSGEELVITVPADAWYQVVIQRKQDQATGFRIREGQAGHTRVFSYQAKEGILESFSTFFVELPPSSSWGEGSYLLKWEGGQAFMQQVPNESILSKMEMTGDARSVLGQNIRTAILMLAAVAIQIVFYLFVITKASRCALKNHRLRRENCFCPPKAHGLLRNPGKKQVMRLKIFALLLCLLALLCFVGFGYLVWAWYSAFASLEHSMIFWYGTLQLLPFALMMLFCGLSALFCGLHAIFWRGGLYRLRQIRLFAVLAFLFTLVLLFVSLTDINNGPNLPIIALCLAQALLLVAVFLSARECKREEREQILNAKPKENA